MWSLKKLNSKNKICEFLRKHHFYVELILKSQFWIFLFPKMIKSLKLAAPKWFLKRSQSFQTNGSKFEKRSESCVSSCSTSFYSQSPDSRIWFSTHLPTTKTRVSSSATSSCLCCLWYPISSLSALPLFWRAIFVSSRSWFRFCFSSARSRTLSFSCFDDEVESSIMRYR